MNAHCKDRSPAKPLPAPLMGGRHDALGTTASRRLHRWRLMLSQKLESAKMHRPLQHLEGEVFIKLGAHSKGGRCRECRCADGNRARRKCQTGATTPPHR